MSLSLDAVPTPTNVLANNITIDILDRIEDDLDTCEKVSILFLLTNVNENAFDHVFTMFNKVRETNAYIIREFVNNLPENWHDKLLEAICVVQNHEIIRKLGLSYEDLELTYIPRNRLCVKNLNPLMKCLYKLCEELTDCDTKLLLQYVKKDVLDYEANLDNINYLELHILYWVKIDYISIYSDGRGNLKNLCKHLKKFDHLELIRADLETCENRQNVSDNQNMIGYNFIHARVSPANQTYNADNIDSQIVKRINKGLCIIVNQISFSGNKYETRFGTVVDSANLEKTFAGFGFKVCTYENLKKKEFLSKIENIPKDFGADYDCLFLCLLSHGCKGGIITSDEEEIPIDIIEKQICCAELTNVIKIVIIQACQGSAMGQMQDTLATDGPCSSNIMDIAPYKNFCIFMSTIPGFVSIRHKTQGSWFIQEFCDILQSRGSIMTFSEIARQIIGSVEKKRGKMYGADSIAQLPELRSYRLLVDFRLPEYSLPQRRS